jgi:hypothetical protein
MLSDLHGHVMGEIQQSSRTDTVFVVSAVLFNLVVLGINWGVASEANNTSRGGTGGNDWILFVLFMGTVIINVFAIRALVAGQSTRTKLIGGLVRMYEDNNIAQYYDPTLLDSYRARYKLFIAVLASLAVIAIVVPLLERLLG